MQVNVRLLYLYLFSLVGLVLTVIGCVRLVNLGLRVYIFRYTDYYAYSEPQPIARDGTPGAQRTVPQIYEVSLDIKREHHREAAGALAAIFVGVPLYLYHWRTIQREHAR